MQILETERLTLNQLEASDAEFILELVNDPGWLRYIGDKGVRNLDDARNYIDNGPRASYAAHGFGLWRMDLKQSGTPIGICGLLKRESLEDPDIGFATLPAFARQGYTYEAARATLDYANTELGLQRIVAITSLDNKASGRLLNKLGLVFQEVIRQPPDDSECRFFATPSAL